MQIEIKNKIISANSPTFIIGEIGINHNGDKKIAKKLIDIAHESEVDAVKFQTYITEEFIQKATPKVEYQKKNDYDRESLFELLKKCELSKEDFIKLKSYTDSKNLIFISTPFDTPSVQLLTEMGVSIYKISSGDLNNFYMLNQIVKQQKPIILSTGMANLKEIKETVHFIKSRGLKDIIVMQCTTNYPTEYNNINLNVISTFKKEFHDCIIGFSDHSKDMIASLGAVSLGAKVIEKHITLNKNLDGPDHKTSLEPDELKDFVSSIRKIELALGSYEKFPNVKELEILKIARKSIVIKNHLNKGDILKEEDITAKRPTGGIPPNYYLEIIDKKLRKNKNSNSILYWEDIE